MQPRSGVHCEPRVLVVVSWSSVRREARFVRSFRRAELFGSWRSEGRSCCEEIRGARINDPAARLKHLVRK